MLTKARHIGFFVMSNSRSLTTFQLLRGPILRLLAGLTLLFLYDLHHLLVRRPEGTSIDHHGFVPGLNEARIRNILHGRMNINTIHAMNRHYFSVTIAGFLINGNPTTNVYYRLRFSGPPHMMEHVRRFLWGLLRVFYKGPDDTGTSTSFANFRIL